MLLRIIIAFAAIHLLSCKAPPLSPEVSGLFIEKMYIDTLEADLYVNLSRNIEGLSIDSLIIPKGNWQRMDNGFVSISEVRRKKVIASPLNSPPKTILQDVPISNIVFGKVSLEVEKGAPHRFNSVVVSDITVGTWIVRGYDTSLDHDAPSRTALEEKIKQGKERIESIRNRVARKVKEYPDHAARNLEASLQELEDQIIEIEKFYQRQHREVPFSTIKVDMAKLEAVERTLGQMEEEVENPENDPILLENKIFFEPGEYIIVSNVNSEKLDAYINTIVKGIQKHNPDRKVRVYIAVTGYADDLPVRDGLKEQLLRSSGKPKFFSELNEEEDRHYNQILSEERARSVFYYIVQRVKRQVDREHVEYIRDYKGMGQIYPPSYEGNCYGDCPKRRVSVISKVIIEAVEMGFR